jgi:hypothetical protein
LCGFAEYTWSFGTSHQYQRERFTFRVLEPLRRNIAKIRKKLCGVTTRTLKNGSMFTTVNDGHKVSYFVNEIELDPAHIMEPYDFAVRYDEAYVDRYAPEDPILRSLRAMSMACLTSKRGCSTAMHHALGAATGSYVAKTFNDCDEACQAYNNGLLMSAVMGAGRFAAVNIPALRNLGCMVNSFAPDTPVLMADGTTKPIKDIRPGDDVLATDPETGKSTSEPVVATIFGTGDKNLVRLTVDTDGVRGDATGTVVATARHPFWRPDVGRWVDAAEIAAGQVLRVPGGTTVQVISTEAWTTATSAANLTVADIHTYYVMAGNTPVLTHNCPAGPASGQGPRGTAKWVIQKGSNSVEHSIERHWRKHAPTGVSKQQYADDAVAWANSRPGRGYNANPVELSDGTIGIRYRSADGGKGGILDSNGDVVTFWYDSGRR